MLSHMECAPLSFGRVIFLLEEHTSEVDRERNARFLRQNYSNSRGDIILVEDDQSKPAENLNISQLGSFDSLCCQIEGWVDHETCQRSAQITSAFEFVFQAIGRLASEAFPARGELDIIQLKAFATHFKLPTWEKLGIEINETLFKDLKLVEKKWILLDAIHHRLMQAIGQLAYLHFPARQSALLQRIKKSLAVTALGYIFVLAGKKHLDLSDQKISHMVKPLFQELQCLAENSHLAG